MVLMEKCSFVVIKKMPKKLKDLGSFTLSIQIGDGEVVHTLNDQRVSINLIPLSMFKTLGLREPRPSPLMIQLEDQTIVPPDFVVMDIDVDSRV